MRVCLTFIVDEKLGSMARTDYTSKRRGRLRGMDVSLFGRQDLLFKMLGTVPRISFPSTAASSCTVMCPYPMHPLPAELLDQIVDHLYNDPASLAASALVCSNWPPSVRRLLFRHITVPCRKLPKLHGIIIHCPEIKPYIKHLDVYCDARGTWAPTCTCFMRKGYTQLGAILTRSPMLHALRLQDSIGFKLSLMMHSVEIVELHNVYVGPGPTQLALRLPSPLIF